MLEKWQNVVMSGKSREAAGALVQWVQRFQCAKKKKMMTSSLWDCADYIIYCLVNDLPHFGLQDKKKSCIF